MNLIDRHILREWLSALGLVLGATLGLLLMQSMYDDLPDLRARGAGVVDMAVYFSVRLPSFLLLVLPLALLVSVLFALGRLHRNNEITALRAAGVGLFRITRSLWLAGALACGLAGYLGTTVVPWSVEASRDVLERLEFRDELQRAARQDDVGVVSAVAFDNRAAGRVWFFNRYSRFTQRGYGLTVSELDPLRREVRRWVAREAARDPVGGGWVLRDGREMRFDPETRVVGEDRPFVERRLPHWNEDPALMLVIDRKVSDLSLFELERLIEHATLEQSPKLPRYLVRYWELFAATLTPLIVIALAVPFAVAGVRVNPAVGVAKALGLFGLYLMLTRVGTGLGESGVLEPWLAAVLPAILMAGVGTWAMARAR